MRANPRWWYLCLEGGPTLLLVSWQGHSRIQSHDAFRTFDLVIVIAFLQIEGVARKIKTHACGPGTMFATRSTRIGPRQKAGEQCSTLALEPKKPPIKQETRVLSTDRLNQTQRDYNGWVIELSARLTGNGMKSQKDIISILFVTDIMLTDPNSVSWQAMRFQKCKKESCNTSIQGQYMKLLLDSSTISRLHLLQRNHAYCMYKRARYSYSRHNYNHPTNWRVWFVHEFTIVPC